MSISRLSGRRLGYFLEVIETGSVRAAAERLHIDASAVSRAVAALEEELGATLLRRQGRGVQVTEIGELVAAHCRRQSLREGQLFDRIRKIQAAESGHIELAVGEGFVRWFATCGVAEFLAARSGVTLNLTIESTREIASRIIDGQADIGVIFQPPESPWLRIHHEVHHSMAALVHRDHPLAQLGPEVRLADLAPWPGILLQDQLGVRRLLRLAELSEGVTLTAAVTTNSFSAAFQLARTGLGYAITADRDRADLGQDDQMVELPIRSDLLAGSRSCIVTRHGSTIAPVAHALLHLLIAAMEEDLALNVG
ncbi:LysR family transcriptional regulator [Pseudooceanicola sp. CBS1P-1]|uniref:LysR family transcriptional regulator n=1 Tax=Pseudooceanicola albus TaxID=2692189 RepID=A0A6L7GCR9_9RHOB|nr:MULTISPECIES: LysR family transcriptional regulator [Pseudooceanicola]MBT9386560.1 LysR family transcriptional regulator [Pseudooceanicola endophyticus]MXN20593.1 LysR family transcriptional regulator [Pseudooceanicola albus]